MMAHLGRISGMVKFSKQHPPLYRRGGGEMRRVITGQISEGEEHQALGTWF
jgi:hypothetical protein